MADKAAPARSRLARLLPEQRICLKSESATRYVTVTTGMQAAACCVGALFAGWTLVATTALTLNVLSADDAEMQTKVMRDAYETRVSTLREQRDRKAHEASNAQTRFAMAMDQMSRQQNALFDAKEDVRELDTEISLMREKLAQAVAERTESEDANALLLSDLQSVTGALDGRDAIKNDLSDTLETIAAALGETSQERDTHSELVTDLSSQVAALELRLKVNETRQDRMFSELEDAVTVSLAPLEELLRVTGLDVDKLLVKVRNNYSGEGGPFLPVTMAGKQIEGDIETTSDRFDNLMVGLDRVNLMQIAASKIPFTMPVRSAHRFTSGFGVRRDPKNGRARMHKGLDFAAPRGTPILATGDGTVIHSGRMSGYGKTVKIRHAFGFETLYAHLNSIDVKVGDRVSRNDKIGGMGTTGRSTGVHLHYEIRIGGKAVNPMSYIKAAKNVF